MNHLVITLFIAALYHAHSHDIEKRSIFSWRSETKEPEPAPTGYLPILKIHKYNGIQINPIQGPPVYLPNGPSDSNNFEGQTAQITPDQIQQLDLINRLASFLPEENLQEVDLSSVLPYVDLISEDSLDKIRFAVESTKAKEKSKLLKFIAFIKYIKEKKLKPFKYAASVGSKIVHKKKEKVAWLFGASPTTTPEPYTETPSPVTYPYNFAYNPYSFQNKQFYNSFSTPAPEPAAPFPSYPYSQYQPNFQFNLQPQKQPNSEQQYQPNANSYQPSLPASVPSVAPSAQYPSNSALSSQYTQFSNQYPSIPSNQYQLQYQFNTPSQPELPTFPANQYQPQYAPLPSAEPSKNDIAYEYKQTPASTFASQDNNAIRQFASSSNNSDYQYSASSSPPKNEASTEQYYSLPSNYIFPFNVPQQPVVIPRIQSPYTSYGNSHSEPNKFYLTPAHTSLPNDLTASGSENVEKINEQVKPENRSNDEKEKFNDLPTSTEISYSKSKTLNAKRTILRQVTPKSPVYEPSSKDESSKGKNNFTFNR